VDQKKSQLGIESILAHGMDLQQHAKARSLRAPEEFNFRVADVQAGIGAFRCGLSCIERMRAGTRWNHLLLRIKVNESARRRLMAWSGLFFYFRERRTQRFISGGATHRLKCKW
jgi:hypothetical protein